MRITIAETVYVLGQVLSNRAILTHSDVLYGLRMAAILGYASIVAESLEVVHGPSSSKFFMSLKC